MRTEKRESFVIKIARRLISPISLMFVLAAPLSFPVEKRMVMERVRAHLS